MMKPLEFREANKPFIDRKHFPYGFKKSGDFSIAEADVLSRYGKVLINLENGEFSPNTIDETHFVDMINGHQPPTNILEKAWIKYVKLTRGKRIFYTLNGAANESTDEIDDDFDADEFDVA